MNFSTVLIAGMKDRQALNEGPYVWAHAGPGPAIHSTTTPRMASFTKLIAVFGFIQPFKKSPISTLHPFNHTLRGFVK